MTRQSRQTTAVRRTVTAAALALALLTVPACAPKRLEVLSQEMLRALGCRIVRIVGEPVRAIEPVADSNLDTLSSDPAVQTIRAVIGNNRRLTARVRHVDIRLPRDRFNVVMTLDGKTHLRANHMDLDIYLETTIDGQAYALHCFPEIAEEGN